MKHLRTITMGEAWAEYRLESDGPVRKTQVPEIFIDAQPLAQLLGVERNLRFYECVVGNKIQAVAESAIRQYTGDAPPLNQFGSPRIVLYRCHCGADYCGVISFSLLQHENRVTWRAINYESDAGIVAEQDVRASGLENYRAIDEISFDADQYMAEFERYRQLRGLSST